MKTSVEFFVPAAYGNFMNALRSALLLVATLALAVAGPIIREPGAIYLSDFEDNPLKLKVLQPARSFFDIKMTRYAGTLRPGQEVEVTAIADAAYRVRGKAQQGQIVAWVDPEYLEPLSEDFVANLKKLAERQKLVAALIENKEVAIGMTTEEVQQSIGKPNKKTARANETEAEQIWEYVKYTSIPQRTYVTGPTGVVSTAVTYIKKPVGSLSIVFNQNVVQSLEQTEGTLASGEQTTIVPAPVYLNW